MYIENVFINQTEPVCLLCWLSWDCCIYCSV